MPSHLPVMATTIACLLVSPAALAQVWYTRVSGPDASGTASAVSVTANVEANGLVVSCSSDGAVALKWILPASAARVATARRHPHLGGVSMVLSTSATTLRFAPSLDPWDKDHIALVVSGGATDLLPALHAIQAARGTILLTAEGAAAAGDRTGAAFSSTGSTAAVTREIEVCDLEPGGPTKPRSDARSHSSH